MIRERFNMSDNNMNGKDFLLGAVVGGVIGAVSALLLAPKTGKELRSDLSDQYQNVSERTQKLANDVSERTQKIAADVNERTQKLAGEVNVRSQEIAGKAKDVASTVTSEIKAWKEAKKDQVEDAVEEVAEKAEK
jgi:gas vesicle protein